MPALPPIAQGYNVAATARSVYDLQNPEPNLRI